MSWGPDPDGVNGVYLGKNVVAVASDALTQCMRAVTPKARGIVCLYTYLPEGVVLRVDI